MLHKLLVIEIATAAAIVHLSTNIANIMTYLHTNDLYLGTFVVVVGGGAFVIAKLEH